MKKGCFAGFVFLICFLGTCLVGQAFGWDDWPHWRGPERNDISNETGLLKKWPESGPDKVWTFKNAGLGYAGIAVVGDQLFTMGTEEDKEFALCLSATDGKELWRTQIAQGGSRGRATPGWGDGSRSTPSVDEDRVYFLSANGTLACLKTADGSEVWDASMEDYGGSIPSWGFAESPLVDDGKVICTPGGDQGTILALDKMTGKMVWQSEPVRKDMDGTLSSPAKAHYSSLLPIELNGKKQYVQLLTLAVVGLDAETGSLLWQSDWPGRTAVIPSPIFFDGKVYVTSGYGVGSKLIDISSGNADDQWMSKAMVNHHGGVIKVGNYCYGSSDRKGWVCQDLSDGKMVWNDKKISKGSVTYADGMFIHVEENDGEVLLIDANESSHEIVSRFVMEPQTTRDRKKGKVWVHPVVASGKLFVRDQDVILCYDISAK
ncbi:MAG: PQQ-binding-like beta-propeller repeat protein [Planctomycetota bacterium]